MRSGVVISILVCLMVISPVSPCVGQVNEAFQALKGLYLGQPPPGDTAVLFAPHIFTAEFEVHGCPKFSPDLHEVYLEMMERGCLFSVLANGVWTAPREPGFAELFRADDGVGCECLAAEGKMMFLSSLKPPSSYSINQHGDKYWDYIWYVTRQDNKWSVPRPVDSVVNTLNRHWQFAAAPDGSLYIPSGRAIHYAKYADNHWAKPVPLPEPMVNVAFPYLSPDASYMVVARMDSNRNWRIGVSFRDAENKWVEPRFFGENVNLPGNNLCPNVTPDGKYLFFINNHAGYFRPYWVDASVIQRLKEEAISK